MLWEMLKNMPKENATRNVKEHAVRNVKGHATINVKGHATGKHHDIC